MFIHADIHNMEEHLSILQKEIKEITFIIEMLTTIYQTTTHPEAIRQQIHFLQKEQERVQERKKLLENAAEKFAHIKRNENASLSEIADMLKHF